MNKNSQTRLVDLSIFENYKTFLLFLTIVGFSTTLVFGYLKGIKLDLIVSSCIEWIYSGFFTSLYIYRYRETVYGTSELEEKGYTFKKVEKYLIIVFRFFPFILFAKPIIITLANFSALTIFNQYDLLIFSFVDFLILYFVSKELKELSDENHERFLPRINNKKRKKIQNRQVDILNFGDEGGNAENSIEKETKTYRYPRESKISLGQGESTFDNVISSVLSRAYSSATNTNRSLIIDP